MTILHSCFSSSNYQKCIIFRALLETGKTAKKLSTYYKERTRATARQKYCTREKRKRTSIIRCLLHIRTEFVAFYVLSLSVIHFCLHQDLILGELTGYCTSKHIISIVLLFRPKHFTHEKKKTTHTYHRRRLNSRLNNSRLRRPHSMT